MMSKPFGFLRWVVQLGVVLVLSVGCDAGPMAEQEENVPTYYGEIQAVLNTNCNSCHGEDGAAPFALDSYVSASAMAEPSLLAIELGQMPPWQPDPDCRQFEHERIMSEEDKELFRRWIDAGKPEGDPSLQSNVVPTPTPVFQATHVARPEAPYTPSPEFVDDYRCLPLDITFDQDMYLRQSMVKPGAGNLVHHVLIYVIKPEFLDQMEAMDAYDEGPGYTCFGGGEVGTPNPVGAWVPGIQPLVVEEDVAMYIPKGSRVVMQVHYNLLVDEPEPDLTEWHMNMSPNPPDYLLESLPFAHRTLEIPAGDPHSEHSKEFVNNTDEVWTIVAMGPHMHLLGVRILVEHITNEGDPLCMIDIPQWDFNWQQNYVFRRKDSVQVRPGESIRLTCTYNNSVENQPSVDGVIMEPRTVTWGDGTLDEMCLSFLTFVRPYEAPAPKCRTFSECGAACVDETNFACVVSCMSVDFDCAYCMIPDMFTDGGCIDLHCKEEMDEVGSCFLDCAASTAAGGGDTNQCMMENCPQERDALDACASPVYEGGYCDSQMVGCGAF
ncbi:MAG: hypothetical protein CMH54_03235 [Myxococcales bacterium]|nr:hypothetical protein [Myxococcales bacterium]|tara:strand:- start:408 stop:2060 length:1653 start_codon:yes stop_codon:yes gene_type:complete